MEFLLDLMTAIQLLFCLIVTVGVAFSMSVADFPAFIRWPLCAVGAGSIIYGAALCVRCWPVVKMGQMIESIGITGVVIGLVILTLKNPRFHNG